LLPIVNIEEYIDRILTHADFLCHHTSGQCQGFVAYYCNDKSTPDAFITLFILAPETRGSGLAASLLNGVTVRSRHHNCSRLTLWVHKQNACAIRFYHRQGFRSCAVREHELLMALPICFKKGSASPLSN
jgi:ribosomal protein S18 acetylase RimI-like enzyme